jgi:hypothetical protein
MTSHLRSSSLFCERNDPSWSESNPSAQPSALYSVHGSCVLHAVVSECGSGEYRERTGSPVGPPERIGHAGFPARIGQDVAVGGDHNHIRRTGVTRSREVIVPQLRGAGCVVGGLLLLAQRLEMMLKIVRSEPAQVVLQV